MLGKTLTTLTIVFLLLTPMQAQSLSEDFQVLRDFITTPGFFPPAERQHLEELLNFAEQQANNSVTRSFVAEQLLEAFLIQLVTLALVEGEDDASTTQAAPEQEEPDPFDILLEAINSINAALFFAAPPLIVQANEPPAPEAGSCGVLIVVQTLGPFLSDPAGTFVVKFADTVRAEAQVTLEGGVLEWKLEPFEDEDVDLFTQGRRALFRAADEVTFRLTASYVDPEERRCQDSIWIQVQGQFDDNGDEEP